MFFAYPLFKDSKKTENGPWDKQYCSGKLIALTNTTVGIYGWHRQSPVWNREATLLLLGLPFRKKSPH